MEVTEALAEGNAAADAIQRIGQSQSAQLVWLACKVLVTAFIVGSLSLGTGYIKDMRDDIKSVATKSEEQDKAMALSDQRIQNLQRVSDATVTTLQSMTMTVQHNTYDIDALKSDATSRQHQVR